MKEEFREEECIDCFGTGTRERDISSYTDITPQYEEVQCWECNGQGFIEVED